jgi:hypothetical protein
MLKDQNNGSWWGQRLYVAIQWKSTKKEKCIQWNSSKKLPKDCETHSHPGTACI